MKKTRTPGLYVHTNGVYYLRREITPRLRSFFGGKAEHKESLGVRDYETAKSLFAAADARFQARLQVAKQALGADAEPMTEERATEIVTAFLIGDRANPASMEQAKRRSTFALAELAGAVFDEQRAQMERKEAENPDSSEVVRFPDPIDVLRTSHDRGDLDMVRPLLPQLRTFAGLNDASSRRGDRLLTEALVRSLLDPAIHRQPASEEATWVDQLVATPARQVGNLRDAYRLWQHFQQPRPQTVHEYGVAVDRFCELFGEIPLGKITARHGRIFRDAHMIIPAHLTREERKRSFRDLYEQFDRNGRGDRPALAPASVKKFIGGLSAILAVSVEEFDLDANPMSRIRIPGEKRGRIKPEIDRRPFSDFHLEKIFASPLFTGCAGGADYQRCLPGPHLYRDDLYWLFILAAATGARLEELGQLLVRDVRTEKGVHFLSLDNLGDDQELKTESSKRRVPIHRKVVALGFLDWARANRKPDAFVFRDVKLNKNDKLTQNLSRRANRYLDRIGIDEENYVFYSFRHKFKDECRDAGIPKEIHDQFTGHAKPDVGSKYGDGAALRKLDDEMKKLELGYFPAVTARMAA